MPLLILSNGYYSDMHAAGHIILTSTGLSGNQRIVEYLASFLPENARALVISTAADGANENKYVKLAVSQLQEIGLRDVKSQDLAENPNVSETVQLIYIAGGNTFKLLYHAQRSNLKQAIKSVLDKGGIVIGVSAGSILMTPDISVAAEIDPDENRENLDDLEAFGFVTFHIVPHYERSMDEQVSSFKASHPGEEVRLLGNGEAVAIHEGAEIKIKGGAE